MNKVILTRFRMQLTIWLRFFQLRVILNKIIIIWNLDHTCNNIHLVLACLHLCISTYIIIILNSSYVCISI